MQGWEVIWGSHRGPPGSQRQGLYQRTETRYVHAFRECVLFIIVCAHVWMYTCCHVCLCYVSVCSKHVWRVLRVRTCCSSLSYVAVGWGAGGNRLCLRGVGPAHFSYGHYLPPKVTILQGEGAFRSILGAAVSPGSAGRMFWGRGSPRVGKGGIWRSPCISPQA